MTPLRASLDGVSHDVRHSFASGAVMSGERPPVVGGILDYTQTQTTARYAHHADDPLYLPTMRTCKTVPIDLESLTQ